MVTGRTSDEDERVGSLLSGRPYRLLHRLAGGSMSAVYVVEHIERGQRCALKVLHPFNTAQPKLVHRVRFEAQAMARLRHPNVAEVIDYWDVPGSSPCLVLELLDGRTLARELSLRTRLPALEAIELACQALSALSAAHALGLVHRDVTPDNLFLHRVPGRRQRTLKVLDFGLVRALPAHSAGAFSPFAPTTTGSVVGSLFFMSPEVARGERADPRADIYSLGVVLYRMLAGRGPFDAGNESPEPPSQFTSSRISAALDAAVLRAIADAPESRHEDASAFRAALLEAASTLAK
jgi:serine/threonine protein kinase